MVKIGDIVSCRIQNVVMPAIVTKVWSADVVNLIAFSDLSSLKIANQYLIPSTSVVRNQTLRTNDSWWIEDEEADNG